MSVVWHKLWPRCLNVYRLLGAAILDFFTLAIAWLFAYFAKYTENRKSVEDFGIEKKSHGKYLK